MWMQKPVLARIGLPLAPCGFWLKTNISPCASSDLLMLKLFRPSTIVVKVYELIWVSPPNVIVGINIRQNQKRILCGEVRCQPDWLPGKLGYAILAPYQGAFSSAIQDRQTVRSLQKSPVQGYMPRHISVHSFLKPQNVMCFNSVGDRSVSSVAAGIVTADTLPERPQPESAGPV